MTQKYLELIAITLGTDFREVTNGRGSEALQKFRAIHEKLKSNPSSLYVQVDAALKRLS
jgi:hypothetical protein